jgi:hypothetical protein
MEARWTAPNHLASENNREGYGHVRLGKLCDRLSCMASQYLRAASSYLFNPYRLRYVCRTLHVLELAPEHFTKDKKEEVGGRCMV